MSYRKKLIEVAIPLDDINRESAREKSIRHGHPSTLHLWWARRPLAACRAVIFASLVDDPSALPEQFPTPEAQDAERERLFDIMRELVKWDNSNNKTVLDAARAEIMRSTDNNPPPLLDPFCGGGSIPLEAQRLGLEAHGSDLNPVAVLITKALIEIPPKFAGKPPVNPASRAKMGGGEGWTGARGLAEDVRYYGAWMRDEAQKRIGHLYPKVTLPREYGGGEATVIAWLWARTVTCPNPACRAQMPLVRSFWLSTKPGKKAWVQPVVDRAAKTVAFEVCSGQGEPPEGTVKNRSAACLICGSVSPLPYIRAEAQAGRMSAVPLAIVAEAQRRRQYLPPNAEHDQIARRAEPMWKPEQRVTTPSHDVDRLPMYGMYSWGDAFTPRQLVALTTFSDLVGEARERAQQDAVAAGLPDDGIPLAEGGTGATAHGEAVVTYLAFALDKATDYWSSICSWHSSGEKMRNTFGRQAIPMVWDYAECNPFSDSSGNWMACVDWTWKVLAESLGVHPGIVIQHDAAAVLNMDQHALISTDPPYYDNIGYADLSDFFYVWLRHSLNRIYPDLFSTMLVPKTQELIATPYRFGGSKQKAQQFFEQGLGKAFATMRVEASPDYPLTVYYAFKQAESESDSDDDHNGHGGGTVASTGWETMLTGLIDAGFTITGTWPMRSEMSSRMIASGTNALASSIVLVCRLRPIDAPKTTRPTFLAALRRELPDALKKLQQGNIAPVDLAQATIGPSMAVFSRYTSVLESDGSPMRVRIALQLINKALDDVLSQQEGDFDAATRWAVAWFEQFGVHEGLYGDAETLSKAKNTSVAGMQEAGIVAASGGKVRLRRREEMAGTGDGAAASAGGAGGMAGSAAAGGRGGQATAGGRRGRALHESGVVYQGDGASVWAVTQWLIYGLESGGEDGAAAVLNGVGEAGEVARELAYRLYLVCERKGWASEALSYNGLVIAWPAITQRAAYLATAVQEPTQLGFGEA